MSIPASVPKPKKRSRPRMIVGECYFTLKRRWQWLWQRKNFAKKLQTNLLPFVVATHHTPLLRKLKDVDMWLQHNKIINLKIAAKKINGLIVKPGQTFSYWYLIRKATKRKGYVAGMLLENGDFRPATGGGLCQLSNLIYWMTLHTPLTVTERWRHGYDVFPDERRTQPFGSGATCSYAYIDLQIRNDTTIPYQLIINVEKTDLIGEWRATEPCPYRYEVYEKDHTIRQEFWGGYTRHNTLYRKIYDTKNSTLLDDHYVTENHAVMMYNPFLEK